MSKALRYPLLMLILLDNARWSTPSFGQHVEAISTASSPCSIQMWYFDRTTAAGDLEPPRSREGPGRC